MPRPSIAFYVGDIAECNTEAIVNAANSQLLEGDGVCGAIFKAVKHPEYLRRECQLICQSMYNKIVPVGSAIPTFSYGLNSKFIIHAVGPNISRKGYIKYEDRLMLEYTYISILNLCNILKLKSVSIPCISTGIFGFPKDEAAKHSFSAILNWIKDHEETSSLGVIRLVFFTKEDQDVYLSFFEKLYPKILK